MLLLTAILMIGAADESATERYRQFSAAIQDPAFEKLASIEFDMMETMSGRPPEFARWILRGEGQHVIMSKPEPNKISGNSVHGGDDVFAEHRIQNTEYYATVLYKEPAQPVLKSVQPTGDSRLPWVPGYTEYFTRLRLNRLADGDGVSIQAFEDAGPDKKRLRLQITRDADAESIWAVLTLDANSGYLLESQYLLESGGTPWRTTKYEYRSLGQAIAVPEKASTVHHALPEHGVEESSETLELTRHKLGATVNESRFRLTHYGLPEPDFVKSKGTPLWVWLLLVGAIMLVGGKLSSGLRRKS